MTAIFNVTYETVYRVVYTDVKGRFVQIDYNGRDELLAAQRGAGRDHVSPRTREELQGQPELIDFLGPMWGGIVDAKGGYVFEEPRPPGTFVCIRYEGKEAYRRLSE